MSRLKISSCRNRKSLNAPASWSKVLFVFLTLCACVFEIQGDVVPLIHNGMDATPGKWPWHATLFIGDGGLCGGTFVDNNTILTAAHCVFNGDSVRSKNDIQVSGGRKYIDATTVGLQELEVANIIAHPEYNHSNFANDIAIIKLTADINITHFVQPVSIWNSNIDENQIFGSHGTVIGFGLAEDDEESDTLQEATIPVLDTQMCLAYDKETYENYLTPQMFCAGGKDKVSACNGDSGGGLFFNISGKWGLRGLVSFSPIRPNTNETLCDSSKPTVFTDVIKYRKWIMRYTNTKKWLMDLKSCKTGTIEKDTQCNAATRFEHGFLLWVLVSEENVSIRRFSLKDDTAFNGHEVLAQKYISWLDKDCVEGRLYWTERETQSIFSAKYDGTDKKVFITKEVNPFNMAVDWISRRLYWVDYVNRTIEVASLDNPDLRTTVMTNVDGNSRIAIDPLQGKLYRTDGNRGIGWSNLDGSEQELLLNTSGIREITVSIATGELCYVNNDTSTIDCMDSRNKRIRTIVTNVTNTDHLAATDEKVFWSSYASDTIESMNLEGMRRKPLFKPNHITEFRSFLVTPVADVCPIFYSPCAVQNGGCPENTICLLNPRTQLGKNCKSTISQSDDLPDPSTNIQSKPITPIRQREAKRGKWPWHATLFIGSVICGGTFVDSSTILTAAQCVVHGDSVRSKYEIQVSGGRKYIDATTQDLQELEVANIIVHPEYNRSNYANDIAIIKLTSDIKITKFVQPVSIWNSDIDENQIFVSQGTVIGFGLEEDDEPADTLQEATIPVLDTQTCLAYEKAVYGKYLTPQMFCAGGKDNVSACNGDSGGGMFFNINNTWFLRGIVSFSPVRPNERRLLCDSFKPAVFTDVAKYRKWIMRHTNTKKWLKDLNPCNSTMEKGVECNAATRFEHDLLLWLSETEENVNIRRFSLENGTAFNGREVLAPKDISRLNHDCVEGRLYWTERETQSIFSAKYDGTDKKAFITKGLEPLNLAVDWNSRRLYWVDHEKRTIEVASLDNPDLRTTVMINVDGNSRIAVDPLQGKLYRTDGNREIGWSNLDGSEQELLLNTSGIRDITVSIATGELCYINNDTSKIDCMDSRNKRIRTIVTNVTNTDHLAATDEKVFWSSYSSDTIESVSLEGVRRKPLLKPNHTTEYRSFLVTPVGNVCPMFYSPCSVKNGGCPENTICLPNPPTLLGKICKSTIYQTREWPWHVIIYNTGYLCGGSILNENTVISAAHCFYYNTTNGYRVMRRNELFVRIGSDYVDAITDDTQLLNVAQIFIHPDYNHSSFANDIAILKLSTDITITSSVRPATIWNAESEQNQLVGMNGIIIGFNWNKDGGPSGKLRETNLTVIDSQLCLDDDNATTGNRVTSHKYCAVESNRNDFCNMDGGGGMYFNVNGTWHLRGIVSLNAMRPNATPSTCDGFKPMVFTDVTKYHTWILRYTNTTQWLKALEPCKGDAIGKDTECNAANRSETVFLLATQMGSIFRVPTNGKPPFSISEGNWMNNLDYDCVESRLYWADYLNKSIFSAKYDGTDKTIFISKDLEEPTFVSVDWISRRLYWLDSGKETIEVVSLDDPELRTTVRFKANQNYGIAVDPLQRKLYTFRGAKEIVSYNLDGSDKKPLSKLTESNAWYTDVKVFMPTGEVCYADTNNRIDCIEPRSKRIRTIVDNLINNRRLAISDEMFYWTQENVIESISHHGVRQKPLTLLDATSGIEFITAVTNVCPRFYSPCAIKNGGCPLNTLCLLNPSVALGKICKCTQNCTETESNRS